MKQKDFYSKRAKEEGYPARSVYKLKEIDRKYEIFKKGGRVLDLGCAPGSWLVYLSAKVGERGRVVGVDSEDLKIPLDKNTVFIQKDIFHIKPEDLKIDQRESAASQDQRKSARIFDAIVSDMAPKTTGMRSADAANSFFLANTALAIAKKVLKPSGSFVCKIFEGEQSEEFFKEVKKIFEFTKMFRPKAVNKASREIYVVGKGFIKEM